MTEGLSPVQLRAFLVRIAYPNLTADPPPPTLETLKTLTLQTSLHIAFSNASLHYSTHHTISLDPDAIFAKLVTQQRGGYCFEMNGLMRLVLCSLGFHFWSSAGWVSAPGGMNSSGFIRGMSHQINLVRLGSEVYLVDVGFSGPIFPMALKEGAIVSGVEPEEFMLKRGVWPSGVTRFECWILQIRKEAEGAWGDLYAFATTLQEYGLPDFEVLNYYTSNSSTSFFMKSFVATRVFRDAEGRLGKLILMDGTLKRRIGSVNAVERIFASEEERAVALRDVFGMAFDDEEIRGIEGRAVALKKET